RQREAVAEPHVVQHRAGAAGCAREQVLEDPHRLEESEAMRLLQQLLGYARIDSPLRGLHSTRTSPVVADRMLSWVKLLACTYSPKKRSMTPANGAMPVPTKLLSSRVSSTFTPRTMLEKCWPESQVVVGLLARPTMPSICLR